MEPNVKLIWEGGRDKWRRVSVRPIELRGKRVWQFGYWDGKQEVHENLNESGKVAEVQRLKVLGYKITGRQRIENLEHDRKKRNWVEQLGLHKADLQDKWQQVNLFVKNLEEIWKKNTINSRPVRVVDLGCGNTYLTKAAEEFFKNLGVEVEMVGVDRRRPQFVPERVKFVETKIADYEADDVDVALALHVCDTGTDEALVWAVKHKAKIILAAPCCQHEMQKQLKVEGRLGKGILKQRLGDVLTDALRANWLEAQGYKTEVVEFVDSKHTPKNILIRAVKNGAVDRGNFAREYKRLKDFWQVEPYVERIFD